MGVPQNRGASKRAVSHWFPFNTVQKGYVQKDNPVRHKSADMGAMCTLKGGFFNKSVVLQKLTCVLSGKRAGVFGCHTNKTVRQKPSMFF